MKICVVGGGSTYTPELVEGLLSRREALDLHEIHLVDTDPGRLGILGPLARRMCTRVDERIAVEWGTDRHAGIAGSTFVVSQMRVGGMAARERDEQLLLAGRDAVGIDDSLRKRQADRQSKPKDSLDCLIDSLDQFDL